MADETPEVVQPKVELVLQSQCVASTLFAMQEAAIDLHELITEHKDTGIADVDKMCGVPSALGAIQRSLVLLDLLGSGLAKQEGRLWPHGTLISGGSDAQPSH